MQRRLRRALGRDKGYLDIRPNVAIESGVAHDPREILVVVDLALHTANIVPSVLLTGWVSAPLKNDSWA
jgi:hypothetical protein